MYRSLSFTYVPYNYKNWRIIVSACFYVPYNYKTRANNCIYLFPSLTSPIIILLLSLRIVPTVSTTFQVHAGARIGTWPWALGLWRPPPCQCMLQYRDKSEVACGQVSTEENKNKNIYLPRKPQPNCIISSKLLNIGVYLQACVLCRYILHIISKQCVLWQYILHIISKQWILC